MMSQDDARLRLEKNIRNYRWLQEAKVTEDPSGFNDRIDACLIAVDAINKLQKIQKIVDDWNNSDIIGDEQDVDRYFCKILELFKEATNE